MIEGSEPRVVIDNGVSASVDEHIVAGTMQELGIGQEAISQTTIYIDGANHLTFNGSVWPVQLARLRFGSNPDLTQATGAIVRLSAKMHGRSRSTEALNKTLVHELEHVAQLDKRDWRLVLGHLALAGFAVLGVVTANSLFEANNSGGKIALTMAGAYLGYRVGYRVAPHERQARQTAQAVHTDAVQKKN